MTADGFALFDTAIGRCGMAWNRHGVAGVQLPEGSEADTRARMARRFPDATEIAPPVGVKHAVDQIVALLRGEASDLSSVALDMNGLPPFNRRVYEVARTIPPGGILTYGDIALRLGDRSLAQAVGRALGKNPFAIIVPCHRVTAAGGKLGGFSANGGVKTKRRLLAIEAQQSAGALPLFARGNARESRDPNLPLSGGGNPPSGRARPLPKSASLRSPISTSPQGGG